MKIKVGINSKQTDEFMVIARIESLILGKGIEDALLRGRSYADSGANGVLIHSKDDSEELVFQFVENFKKDFDNRIEYMKKALDINPNHAEANYEYGLSLTTNKDFVEAKKYVLKGLELNPYQQRYYPPILCCVGLEEYEEAINYCNKSIEVDPNFTGAYGWKASMLAHLGRIDEAKQGKSPLTFVTQDSAFNDKVSEELNIIIKSDVHGSSEAIKNAISKIEHDEVKPKIILADIGMVTETDVTLAKASNAVLIAFNVKPSKAVSYTHLTLPTKRIE